MEPTVLALAEKLASTHDAHNLSLAVHCPLPVFQSDLRGMWTHANAPLLKLLACDARDLLADSWIKWLHPHSLSHAKRDWLEAINDKPEVRQFRWRFAVKDGRVFGAKVQVSKAGSLGMVGFIVPSCTHPRNCPIHNFLLDSGGDAACDSPGKACEHALKRHGHEVTD